MTVVSSSSGSVQRTTSARSRAAVEHRPHVSESQPVDEVLGDVVFLEPGGDGVGDRHVGISTIPSTGRGHHRTVVNNRVPHSGLVDAIQGPSGAGLRDRLEDLARGVGVALPDFVPVPVVDHEQRDRAPGGFDELRPTVRVVAGEIDLHRHHVGPLEGGDDAFVCRTVASSVLQFRHHSAVKSRTTTLSSATAVAKRSGV